MKSNFAGALLGVVSLFAADWTWAGDWPQWRGPTRDGQASESAPLQLPSALEVVWRMPLGHGYAGPVVAEGIVVVLDETAGQETAHAITAATGKKLWSAALGESYADEFEPGPRCTPLIDGDRVYAQTTKGELRCLSKADGALRWRTHFADFGAKWISERGSGAGAASRRGNSGSPIVVGDRLLVQVGSADGASIVAFDKLTGKVLWKSQNDLTCYSSPVVATLAGRPQFVAATCEGLLALAPEDGALLWRVPFKTGANRNVLTPLLLDDTVYFASYTTGLRAVRVRAAGTQVEPVEQWLNRDLKVNLSSPVAVDGFLYGLGPTKDFICVDRATGQRRWSQSGFGDVASTIALGRRLLVLTDMGELLLLAANPDRYEELGRVQVCGKTFSHPALAQGVLYVRDPKELQALRLATR